MMNLIPTDKLIPGESWVIWMGNKCRVDKLEILGNVGIVSLSHFTFSGVLVKVSDSEWPVPGSLWFPYEEGFAL